MKKYILSALFTLGFIQLQAQAVQPLKTHSERFESEILGEVVFKNLPISDRIEIYNVKAIKQAHPSDIESASQSKGVNEAFAVDLVSRGVVGNPSVAHVEATDVKAFQPADNTIAISDRGQVMVANNLTMALYDSAYTLVNRVTLENFFKINNNPDVGQQVFDPQILFDPIRNRWVAAADYAEYNKTNGNFDLVSNRILLAFSQTSDPAGAWRVYSIPGMFTIDNTTFVCDFPTLAFTKNELFVMVPLSKLTGTISHQGILELDFNDGYAGKKITGMRHSIEDIAGFSAAHNNFENDNTRLWMVHTAHSPGSRGTKNLDIAYIDGQLPDTTHAISSLYHIDLHDYYFKKNASPQKGGKYPLAMAGCVVRSCFYDKGMIYGTFTTVKAGKTAIYLFRVQVDNTDPEFSKSWSQIIAHPTYDLGYTSLQFAGIRDDNNVDGVLIAANYTAANTYPGYGLYYVSPYGGISDFTELKTGEGYYNWPNAQDTPARWGDYTGIAKQYNKPFKFAVSGQFATADNKVGSHFSIIDNTTASTPKVAPPQANAFPNPSSNLYNVLMQLSTPAKVHVSVINMQGAEVMKLENRFLKAGWASLDMDVSSLQSGNYSVVVKNELTGAIIYSGIMQVKHE